MTAHTAVVFTRYMMLSLENRESNDNRSLGELFLYFSDEMSDITWIQAFQMLLQMFRAILSDTVELSETKIDELVDAFMSAIPTALKSRLQALLLAKAVTIVDCKGRFLSDHSAATSGYCEARSLNPASTLL